MNDKEFAAMLSLLDDPDKEVRHLIESQLQTMGTQVLPRISAYADQLSAQSALYLRLTDLIFSLRREEFAQDLIRWSQTPAPALRQGWLLVSQLLLPHTDPALVDRELNRLVSRAWLEIRTGMSLPEKLVIVNRLMFRYEMFRAEADELRTDFLLLPQLLEQRSGTPLSLCLLHTLLCEALNLPGNTILLPDYAIAFVQDPRHQIFIDVFNKGAFFVRTDLQRFLRDNNLEEDKRYFEPTPPVVLIHELLHTLAAIYSDSGDYQQATKLKNIADKIFE